jgi:hypothetical protein
MCDERWRLEKRQNELAIAADAGVKGLLERIGVCSRDEFRARSHEVERCWRELQQARAALDSHIGNHGCLANAAK